MTARPADAMLRWLSRDCQQAEQNSVLMGFLFDRGPYPLAAVIALSLAGVAADLLRAGLRPAASRPSAFRWFAFSLPVILYVAYFIVLALTTGIGYTPHLWMGVIVFAGIIGWLMSYLVLAPRLQPSA